MTARDEMIAAGILRPGPPCEARGEPTPEREGRTAPCLRLDGHAVREAQRRAKLPGSERVPMAYSDPVAEP